MKNSIILLVSILFACRPSVSIQLEMNSLLLYECKEAKTEELSPKNGGYRFICSDTGQPQSVYVIYDTSKEDANDGTIKEIWTGQADVMKTAVYSSARGNIDCPSAKVLNRKTGEPPFPETFYGSLKKGSHNIEMARPCGTLVFTIR
jgi:hypothetical protein